MYEGDPREIDFGWSLREVRVSEGSSYRESTVFRKLLLTSAPGLIFVRGFTRTSAEDLYPRGLITGPEKALRKKL